MSGRRTTRSNSGRGPLPWWLLVSLALVFAAPAYSQSLGEVARQDREHKLNQPRTPTHVYTNEDLERSQILVPEDRERIQAKKQASPPAAEPAPETAGDEPKLGDMPLGDVARYYRALKAAQQKNEQELPPGTPEFMPSLPAFAYPGFPASDAHLPPPPMPVDKARSNADSARALRNAEIPNGVHVRVRRGDTLWGLSRKYLGRGRDWMLVAAINPHVADPTHLRIGTLLLLPDRTQLAAARAKRSLAPGSRALWKDSQLRPMRQEVSGVAGDRCRTERIPQDAALESAQPNRKDDLQVAPQRSLDANSSCLAGSGHAPL